MAVETKWRSVAGLMPVSMVDWQGKLAAVLFMKGCNFRCPFCHNPELVLSQEGACLEREETLAVIEEKNGWIDGVVISGGEPTICADLFEIVSAIRGLGLGVKLDTNGSRPEIIRDLLAEGSVDSIAMDIKTTWDKYDEASGARGKADAVRTSVDIVIGSGVDHEFRTTAVPGLVDVDEALKIARYLGERRGSRYVLQQFKGGNTLDPGLASRAGHSKDELEKAASDCGRFIPTKIRAK